MEQPFKKIALYTDIHFGRSSNSELANQDNIDFLTWFIDRAKTHGVDAVAFLGDYFDNRNQVHVSTLNYGLKGLEMLNDAFPIVYHIVGNHDLFYRDKRDVTSLSFAKHLPNIKLINDPLTLGHGKNEVTFLPWLVSDEKKQVRKLKSKYVFMHGELSGFMMNAKVPMPAHPNGIDSSDFENVGLAMSGHFHYRQISDNNRVLYVGNTFPMNFSDANDYDRGMTILQWGKDPIFEAWKDQPTYGTMNLSDILHSPDKFLRNKLTARVTLDIDISYEEAQVIRDEYARSYGVRKIELIHASKSSVADQEFAKPVAFQSVDQIVIDGLLSVKSETLDKNVLVDIYRNLATL